MRLAIFPIFLAGASVVSVVAAEAAHFIDDPSSTNANANIRFGHALANANVNGNDDSVARTARPIVPITHPSQSDGEGLARHCGASLREKAIRLSNAFRHALGMPLIEPHFDVPRPGQIHVLHLGYPIHSVMPDSQGVLDEEGKPRKHHGPDGGQDHPHHGHHAHHGHHGHHRKHRSFLKRIHHAIKALGPWEGRAVAFVLGCGIGVLLRMFWVLSVLAYRTVRGERGEESLAPEYIVYEHIPETLFVAPPQYVDERVEMESEEKEALK